MEYKEPPYPKQVFFTNGMFMVMRDESEEAATKKEHPQWFFPDKEPKTETVAAPVVVSAPVAELTTAEPIKKKLGRPKGS
jgi:hypothetical protein